MKSILAKISFSLFILFPFVSMAQLGSLDNSFHSDGKVFTFYDTIGGHCNALALQDDQKIIAAGYKRINYTIYEFALARYLTNGDLDPTFGTLGRVITPIEPKSKGTSLGIQNDGKIVLGGFSQNAMNVARYNPSGDLDTTFGTGGFVITEIPLHYGEQCNSLHIQNDGKILIGGQANHWNNDYFHFVLLRYLSDGSLDSTFGVNGIVVGGTGYGRSISVQADSKILLGGQSYSSEFKMERYNEDGTLDVSFGTAGEVITSIGESSGANALSLQDDGKILLSGYSYNSQGECTFALARYAGDGQIDNSFGANGTVLTPVGNSNSKINTMKVLNNGDILVAGDASTSVNYSDFSLVLYSNTGDLNAAFGSGGKVVTPMGSAYSNGHALVIQDDGKIVLGGNAYNGDYMEMSIARYNGATTSLHENCCNISEISVHPNPFYGSATIRFDKEQFNSQLKILDIYGKEVKSILNVSGNETQISGDNLDAGIYFVQLISGNKIESMKKILITSGN